MLGYEPDTHVRVVTGQVEFGLYHILPAQVNGHILSKGILVTTSIPFLPLFFLPRHTTLPGTVMIGRLQWSWQTISVRLSCRLVALIWATLWFAKICWKTVKVLVSTPLRHWSHSSQQQFRPRLLFPHFPRFSYLLFTTGQSTRAQFYRGGTGKLVRAPRT